MKKIFFVLLFCCMQLNYSMENDPKFIETKYQHWDPLHPVEEPAQEPHKTVTLFLQALMSKQLTFDNQKKAFIIKHAPDSPPSARSFVQKHEQTAISLYEASIIVRGIKNSFLERRPIKFDLEKKPINYSRSIEEFDDFYQGYDLSNVKNKSEILDIRKQLVESISQKIPLLISKLLEANYTLMPASNQKIEKKSPKKHRKSNCHSQ
ncbi:MAG: hypothetical protein ACOYT8_04015 [Candidatus Dependentiae bacterium]